jgi:hypothetical protein
MATSSNHSEASEHSELMSVPCSSPRPGPLYWDWRCLICSFAISEHDSLTTRLAQRLMRAIRHPRLPKERPRAESEKQ